jgi:hypothetical protein
VQTPTFPKPTRECGRLYWSRAELEQYKRALLCARSGADTAPIDAPAEGAVVELVPASQVAKEFGFGRRTLGRRIAEAEAHARTAG